MKWLHFAWKNIGRNKRRSWVTILLTAIGTLGILTTSGFALYTYESLKEFATRETGHVILHHPDYFLEEEELPLALGLDNYRAIQQTWLADMRIKAVIPQLNFTGLITNGDKSTIFMGEGIDAQLLSIKGQMIGLVEGDLLSNQPSTEGEAQVLLGRDLARSLSATVGSELTLMTTTTDGALNALDVEVRGIFSTGIPELDKRLLNVRIESAQQLLYTERVSTLHIHLHDTGSTEHYRAQLEAHYPQLGVTPWKDRAFFYNSVRNLYNRIFGVMGVVILAMVMFAVFNTMSMTVMERTREIGTFAAQGTFRWEIMRNFVYEGLLIGLTGALLGMLLAAMISFGLSIFDVQMPPPPGQTTGYPLLIYMDSQLYLSTSLSMVIICVVAAWIATRRGVNKPIVEALAYV